MQRTNDEQAGQQNDLKQEYVEEQQVKPPKRRYIKKLRPGRPRKVPNTTSTIQDFLSIHEETLFFALLWMTQGIPSKQQHETLLLKSNEDQDLPPAIPSIEAKMDQHLLFTNSPGLRVALMEAIDNSEPLSRLLTRVGWVCPQPQLTDILVLLAVMLLENKQALMGKPEDTLDVIDLTMKELVGRWHQRLWEMLPNLRFQADLAANDEELKVCHNKFSDFVLMLLTTVACIFKVINQNPFHDKMYAMNLRVSPPASPKSEEPIEPKRSTRKSATSSLKRLNKCPRLRRKARRRFR